MKKSLLIVLLLACLTANAQRYTDYFVVTTKGDTIFGHLKYQTSEGDLHNKVTLKNDTTKITFAANELIYFEEGLNEYYSFVPEGQKEHYFIRVWATGYFELFEWEVPMAISKKKNLIEYRPYLRKKGDTEFITLDHKKWKHQLAELFAEYPELANDIKKGLYAMDEMNHIVDKFNEWKEEQIEGGW
jgi:hypothetical protein